MIPAKASGSRVLSRRIFKVLIPALIATTFIANLAAPDLLVGLFPACPFLALTGYRCPGCGSVHAISALARGDVVGAFAANPFAAAGLPLLLVLIVLERKGRLPRTPAARRVRVAAIGAAAAGLLLYGILRNLP